jgi:hypothetical protein
MSPERIASQYPGPRCLGVTICGIALGDQAAVRAVHPSDAKIAGPCDGLSAKLDLLSAQMGELLRRTSSISSGGVRTAKSSEGRSTSHGRMGGPRTSVSCSQNTLRSLPR